MAEIILPPEEDNEITPPDLPELNIDKPTENSKVITIEFEAKKTNKVNTKDTNQQLYTTDTDAWFEFKETSLENANGTYSVVFRNRHDGSIFQRTGNVVNGIAYYKIPHQEIRHAGAWRGQVVYTLGNGDTTASEFDYDVKGHMLDGKDVREIVVEDFETLMSQLRSMKESAEVELADLAQKLRSTTDTAEQNETDRQAFFDELVEDINEFEENERQRQTNEQGRESAESERVSNEEERELSEAERISKDSERDSKIDSKANQSMLLNPKYDLVYDSCVRDVDTSLDAYSVPMESGHYFENVEDRDSDTTLTYRPDGVLLARPALRHGFSPILIEGFDVDSPYFDVRIKNIETIHDPRFWFIKYKDKDNWVGVRVADVYEEASVIATVEGIQTVIATEGMGSLDKRQAHPETIYSLKAEIIRVHPNFAETRRALRVFKNKQFVLNAPIPTNAMDFPNRVGFSVGGQTEILNFKAGRSR